MGERESTSSPEREKWLREWWEQFSRQLMACERELNLPEGFQLLVWNDFRYMGAQAR